MNANRHLYTVRSAALALSLGSAACAMGGTPPATGPTTATLQVPAFVPTVEGQETQTKGTTTVRLTPSAFEIVRDARTTCTKQSSLIRMNDQDTYTVQETPSYRVTPEGVMFQATVANEADVMLFMERGIIIGLVVAEREITLPDSVRQLFNNKEIVEHSSREFEIGPIPLTDVRPGDTVTLHLRGVPVELDRNGESVARKSFRWTFRYDLHTEQKTDQVTTSEVPMTAAEASNRCDNI